ncbi:hypothetical protein J3B02_000197 [Coemansia erecta]|uniref:GrpB family protein n=1 Tax=Coemansia asiatica TaxID=1052880 RepID=A0A9W8CIU5_9FUNG|nr:hypothetical protein LPJ64_002727 [Coemansia asiatica]KAJ2858447.1 hypothetical protein J3B02_000197 [Coemansia erecta]KAJ2888315.1 hypothetical protein FB639_000723 [Coemansia asiatica]
MEYLCRKASRHLAERLTVIPYTPIWAKSFEQESHRVKQQLGTKILGIEHIGSTSIPGMSAKPIIDIDILIPNFSQLPHLITDMDSLDYVYKGECGIPGREYFKRLGFHVHMMRFDNEEHLKKLVFLEYLKQHPDTQSEYVGLKVQLAKKWFEAENGPFYYNQDKTEFILSVLEKAGWHSEQVRSRALQSVIDKYQIKTMIK